MSKSKHGLLEPVMPVARAVKYALKHRRARADAARPFPGDDRPLDPPPAFVLGCGRSGTTLIGEVFSLHPQVCYLFEPYHLWDAVDPATDMINFYSAHEALCLMDERHATPEARRRFTRAMHAARARSGRPRLIEKTPINAMRLGYLRALAPGAAYLHMVRDGVDVARSIGRLAARHSYKVVGKPDWNAWWGRRNCKWAFLARDGAAAGHFPDEVPRLTDDAQRGAYEWIVSLAEVEKHRPALGERLLDVPYTRLTSRPRETLAELCRFFGIDPDPPGGWLDRAAAMVGAERRNPGEPLRLPPRLCEAFNTWQARFGFEGRAEALPSPAPAPAAAPAAAAAPAPSGAAP